MRIRQRFPEPYTGYLTMHRLAQLAGCAASSVRWAMRQGRLAATQLYTPQQDCGYVWAIAPDEADRWIAERRKRVA